MEKDLEDLLNFYLCPEPMRIKLRTTNVIERAFREVRRRTRPMSCFNNNKSIERIIYAVLKSFKRPMGKKALKRIYTKELTLSFFNMNFSHGFYVMMKIMFIKTLNPQSLKRIRRFWKGTFYGVFIGIISGLGGTVFFND